MRVQRKPESTPVVEIQAEEGKASLQRALGTLSGLRGRKPAFVLFKDARKCWLFLFIYYFKEEKNEEANKQ